MIERIATRDGIETYIPLRVAVVSCVAIALAVLFAAAFVTDQPCGVLADDAAYGQSEVARLSREIEILAPYALVGIGLARDDQRLFADSLAAELERSGRRSHVYRVSHVQ